MGESGPLLHPSRGAHSGEGSCHTRSSSPHRFVDVTLGPWVRGKEGIEAWMEVGTDARVLLPWLRCCRGQSAWAPPGPFLTALTRKQPAVIASQSSGCDPSSSSSCPALRPSLPTSPSSLLPPPLLLSSVQLQLPASSFHFSLPFPLLSVLGGVEGGGW